MATISDLLNWKKEIPIKNNKEEEITKVWIRVLGDFDLNESFRQARIASSSKRRALKDINSDEYLDEIVTLEQASENELKALVKASKQNVFLSEAFAKLERKDLPKIEEIAIEPDAPSLEEQEKLDTATEKVNQDYQNEVQEYLKSRIDVLDAELDALSREELVERAKTEYLNISPMSAFMDELAIQKVYRAVYKDEACKIRMYPTKESFIEEYAFVKEQLTTAYAQLELEPEEVKN